MDILENIYNYYGKNNVQKLNDTGNLLRCEKKNIESAYEICYIDKSVHWTDANYLEYIENNIATNYYENPGYLQWNYYYYFISPKNIINENIEQKKKVEGNGIYARKYIMTEPEFVIWLKDHDNIYESSEDEVKSDLYGRWIDSIRNSKLYFVYDKKYSDFKTPIDKYMRGENFTDPDIAYNDNDVNDLKSTLNKIESLELKQFRAYPKDKVYNFGDVNLIQGPNASGKTSLLDTLELIITGTQQKNSFIDEYKLIFVEKSNNQIWDYPESHTSIYKTRDIHWYNSGKTRGHSLNLNFNKFNYYNSDAAFELKMSKDTNIEQIIADITLGREVNRLEEKITGFTERFESLSNNLSKEIKKLKIDLESKQSQLKSYTESFKNPISYLENFLQKLNDNYWLYRSTNKDETLISEYENIIQIVLGYLDNIKSKNIAYENLNLVYIRSEIEQFKSIIEIITPIKEEIRNIEGDLIKAKNELHQLESLQALIKELQPYYKNENIKLLIGLKDSIGTQTSKLNSLLNIREHSLSFVNSNNLMLKEIDSKTVSEIETFYLELKGILTQHQAEVNDSINQIEEGIGNLTKVVNNIKALGKEYITLRPDIDACPLCNTSFSKDSLFTAIENSREVFTNSQTLTSLHENRVALNSQLDEAINNLEIINDIKGVAYLLYGDTWIEKKFSDILRALNNNDNEILKLTETLNKNKLLQQQFDSESLNEDHFHSLYEKLNMYTKFDILDRTRFEIIQNQYQEEYEIINLKIKELQDQLTAKEYDYKSTFSSKIINEFELTNSLKIYQELETYFEQLNRYVDINKYLNILSIQDSITIVRSAFETYKNEFYRLKEQNQSINILTADITKLETEIDEIDIKYERAKFAFETLNKLLKENDKIEFLSSYINSNRKEIVSIFSLIHSPKEFNDIIFKEGKICLKSISDKGKLRSLEEISSGQRSALALSVFLSLNKKLKKGPNIILFDDPVTYVDDMNILSFFDYLRELSLQTKRQIFFATANSDVAFLFKKKFDFLKDEFVNITLERNEGMQPDIQSSVTS